MYSFYYSEIKITRLYNKKINRHLCCLQMHQIKCYKLSFVEKIKKKNLICCILT